MDASLHILHLSVPNPTNVLFETTPLCGPSPIFSCRYVLGLLFICVLYILHYLDSGLFGSWTWEYQAPPVPFKSGKNLIASGYDKILLC